jgi:tripartite-type tricarboxylate transporter receptor subunit TctC
MRTEGAAIARIWGYIHGLHINETREIEMNRKDAQPRPRADHRGRSLLLALLLTLPPATAQPAPDGAAYPSRPIRLVVPFPAGASPNDIIARLVGRQISESVGQQVIVDNRAGAGGTIGSDIVAKAAPDGYTVLINSTTFTISPNVYRQLPFDLTRDFQPITTIAQAPMMLMVHPAVPAGTLKEFLAYARAKPDQLKFGSGGNGTVPHFAGEMLKSMARIQMSHVPYKGGSPAVAALLGGEVNVYIDTPTAVLPLVQQGRLRALAVTTKERAAFLPELPTLDEAGVPGYEMRVWYGFYAPAKTPQPVVQTFHREVVKALENAEVKSRLAAIGTQPMTTSTEKFQVFFQSEVRKYAKLAREVGVMPE